MDPHGTRPSPLPDLAALSDEQLEAFLLELESAADHVARPDRLLEGKIDVVRAELAVRRRRP